jgi:helix-turn-helix protein
MEETTMRGRTPAGPEYVEQLQGSPQAKQRLRVVLETMAGKLRVQEACARLGISEQRFDQLRAELLQAALAELEPKPAGRPRRPVEDPRVTALQEQVAELEQELRTAGVREALAVALPQAAQPVAEPAEPEKKTPASRRLRRGRPGWWKK